MISRYRNRRPLLAVVMGALVALAAVLALSTAGRHDAQAQTPANGSVVLMGIDAEDNNGATGNDHGGKQPYIDVASSVKARATNAGTGILVFGCGKNAADDVTGFWTAVATGIGEPLTCVNGEANIAARSLSGFKVVGVASSDDVTPSGGLTQSENNALANRRNDIANFVDTGGGFFGLAQSGFTNPFAYLATLGTVTINSNLGYSNVEATPEGEAVGITDTNLDVVAWHDEFTQYPSFLKVLAVNVGTGRAAALGGASVRINNRPPEADDDRYRTREDKTLGIGARGVLANDGDPERDPITARLASGPAHGKLDLKPNGAFVYKPNRNYHGTDTFRYRAADDRGARSNVARVTITVVPVADGPKPPNPGPRPKRCTITGTPGPDALRGTNGNDVICGLGGNDAIDANGGNDAVRGGAGMDTLHSGFGNDALDGGSGDDLLYGGFGDDTLKGAAGRDRLHGEVGNDTLRGGPGRDKLLGGPGRDKEAQ